MCTAFFALNSHPQYDFVVVSNRDEFYARKTSQAAFWADHPEIFAGRDQEKGGTWLGVNRRGRLGLVTNIRSARRPKENLASRGELVREYLAGDSNSREFSENKKGDLDQYGEFNLILIGSPGEPHCYLSNRERKQRALSRGIYGISNHLLETPWPKVKKGKKIFEEILSSREPSIEAFFTFMRDRQVAADSELPDTGIGVERERQLSSLFIQTPVYGTRSTTLVLRSRDRKLLFIERVYVPGFPAPIETSLSAVLTND